MNDKSETRVEKTPLLDKLPDSKSLWRMILDYSDRRLLDAPDRHELRDEILDNLRWLEAQSALVERLRSALERVPCDYCYSEMQPVQCSKRDVPCFRCAALKGEGTHKEKGA